jgi:CheY-like chemotaxis protein/HPt (histidine-containing phosphotransfer) domain-containing protein
MTPVTPSEPTTGKSILLVDDVAMNRDVIGSFLRHAGHEVLAVDSGQEAVRLASGQVFDLILMDLRMPEMDGLEATRLIRGLPAPRGWTPIIALTAHAFPEQVSECQAAGMDGHIAKPVQYATLMQAIADAIAGVMSSWRSHSPPPPPLDAEQPPPEGFDRAVFGQICELLPPDEIATNLQLLREQQEHILRLLDEPGEAAVLSETAHTLASSAGMFGFAALSTAARSLERALTLDAPEAGQLARQVRDETQAGLVAVNGLMRADLMPST